MLSFALNSKQLAATECVTLGNGVIHVHWIVDAEELRFATQKLVRVTLQQESAKLLEEKV